MQQFQQLFVTTIWLLKAKWEFLNKMRFSAISIESITLINLLSIYICRLEHKKFATFRGKSISITHSPTTLIMNVFRAHLINPLFLYIAHKSIDFIALWIAKHVSNKLSVHMCHLNNVFFNVHFVVIGKLRKVCPIENVTDYAHWTEAGYKIIYPLIDPFD